MHLTFVYGNKLYILAAYEHLGRCVRLIMLALRLWTGGYNSQGNSRTMLGLAVHHFLRLCRQPTDMNIGARLLTQPSPLPVQRVKQGLHISRKCKGFLRF